MCGGIVEFFGKIRRFLGFGWLGTRAGHLTPAQNPDRQKELLLLYRQDKDANGYDLGIVGHTHQAGRIGDWYCNSGTWARKTNSFVRIDPDGAAAVFNWVNGQAVPNKHGVGDVKGHGKPGSGCPNLTWPSRLSVPRKAVQ